MASPFDCSRPPARPCFVSHREEAPPLPKSRLMSCREASLIPVLRKIHSNKPAWPSATRVQANLHLLRRSEAEESFPTQPAYLPLVAKYAAERPPAADTLLKRTSAQVSSRFDRSNKARHLARLGHGSLLRQSIDADLPA